MSTQHSVRAGELAARIYEGWAVEAVKETFAHEDNLKYVASLACDAAAIFMVELRRRDPITCELVHGQLPLDVEDDNEL